ncbi:uncharacterized protein LOC128728412 [Anopheles nili]|uniref:uncharacterized protein LOC128728412 n=1 Tax=Anopheles nili TaxID=185578 RepID=UPI00237C2EC8|nr:uncharacterized protein LOC128728412 [Anopheles nili]
MVGMSNFVLNSSTLEAMIGQVSLGVTTGQDQRREQERRALVEELLAAVRECQKHYGSKTELATEQDPRILALCDVWERALSHGLRSTGSMLQNVVELVGGAGLAGGSTEGPWFWDFAYRHLTNHEKERFSTLRHVWSRCGRGRALLRAILNERALERYVLVWLSDDQLLTECYEPWAMLLDGEVQGLLPSTAAGLSTILFAIAIDTPDLNVAKRRIVEEKPEPIIATRRPVGPVRKINAVQREILEEAPQSQCQLRQPVASLGTVPLNHPKTTRSDNIDIVQGEPATPDDELGERVEAYSVEEALKSLHLTQESPQEHEPVVLRYRKEERRLLQLDESSSPPTPETTDESMLACNYSTVTSTSGTSDSGESGLHRPLHGTNDEQEDMGRNRTFLESSAAVDLAALAASQHPDERIPRSGFDKLKRKYHELEERCHLLESRVAELSLENHRLRMLTRANRLSVAFFSFSIPKAIQRTSSGGRSRRPYHVYEIRITPSGVSGSTTGNESWCVYRRYNEFYRLHRRLQKEYTTVKMLDFPPKKKIGNMNAEFVEQRRQRLQVYLNSLFVSALPEVSSCSTRTQLEQTFPFLSEHPPSSS